MIGEVITSTMSKNRSESDDQNFPEEMEALAAEAERLSGQPKGNQMVGFLQALRPLVLGLEGLGRATIANTQKIDQLLEKQGAQTSLFETISGNQAAPKEGINQQLFDALHDELRGYKDNFLLEILQKPIIRDLILLYDDLSEMHSRLELFLKDNNPEEPTPREFLRHFEMNLDHAVSSVIETLARLDVVCLERSSGKLDPHKHRAVAVVEAATPDENGEIHQSLKPCFVWRDRIFRAEEVSLKKWSATP